MNYLPIFAGRLKMLREEKGLTQEKLAEIIGSRKSTISQYENCKREPVVSMIKKLSVALDVSVGYLLAETDFRNNSVKKTS